MEREKGINPSRTQVYINLLALIVSIEHAAIVVIVFESQSVYVEGCHNDSSRTFYSPGISSRDKPRVPTPF
jgi:hypothetical protein